MQSLGFKRVIGGGANNVLMAEQTVMCIDCKAEFREGYFCTCLNQPVCTKCMLDKYPPRGNSHFCSGTREYEHPLAYCKGKQKEAKE